MYLSTTITILSIFFLVAPVMSPFSYAISASTNVQNEIQLEEDRSASGLKFKGKKKFRLKVPRPSPFKSYGPKELFFSGLIMAGIGALMILGASRTDTMSSEAAFKTFMLSFLGTIVLAGGFLITLIGGISWLLKKAK